VIVGWGQSTFDQIWPTLGPVPLLGFNNGQGAITMLGITRGYGDGYLLAMSESARNLDKPVYIRPFGEMNGHWNAYCAYNTNGTPRGVAYSTANFRKAFARIYLIMHGGPTIDATLKRLGMPPVRLEVPTNPFVKVVWNPQGYGSPDVPGNSAQAYYPGDRYVDIVGDDLYDIGGKAEFAAADKLYKAHPSKPFSFPEWGLWGIDDPSFVKKMADFVKTHHRTKFIAYFNAKPGSIFDLASKPRSLAAYKRYIVPLGA
jgi:beta-mannanase